MMTVRRHEARGAGITMGRTVIAPSRSLEPLDVADPGAVQIGAQPLYRSADDAKQALVEAKAREAAQEAAREEIRRRSQELARTSPTGPAPGPAPWLTPRTTILILVVAAVIAFK